MENYKVLGLNSGLGVPLFPFVDQLIANIETRAIFHTPKNEQWVSNFGNKQLIKKFDAEFPPIIVPNVDVMISTPDCGAGSVLRLSRSKKLGNHKNNNSLLQFFSGLKRYKPKIFLFENLQALFKSFSEKEFREACKGYYLVIHNESVTAWGNSQKNRKRLVIVGIRKDLKYKKIRKHFKHLPTAKYLKNCKELSEGLNEENVELGHVREDCNKTINVYGGKWMTPKQMRKEWKNRLKGKTRWYIDPSENRKMKTAPGVYRNGALTLPATARKANRQFNYQGYMMSPRELARIMGVPDDFKIHIDMANKQYWINKARTLITKGMVYEISTWFKESLDNSYHLWKASGI